MNDKARADKGTRCNPLPVKPVWMRLGRWLAAGAELIEWIGGRMRSDCSFLLSSEIQSTQAPTAVENRQCVPHTIGGKWQKTTP